ncbi:MAG: carboxylesterase family protein, partial [Lachnospiraceae bacterium]|nr:carboxylesterase family protein [Lachnospiraceae bacterium]
LWRHPGLYDEEDYQLSDTMQQYWVNFVKTGNPNGEGLPEWKARTKDQSQLLQLDTNIQMVDDPNEALYQVIDQYQAKQ